MRLICILILTLGTLRHSLVVLTYSCDASSGGSSPLSLKTHYSTSHRVGVALSEKQLSDYHCHQNLLDLITTL